LRLDPTPVFRFQRSNRHLAYTSGNSTVFDPAVLSHPERDQIVAHELIHQAQFRASNELPVGTRAQLEQEARNGSTTGRPAETFAPAHRAPPGMVLYDEGTKRQFEPMATPEAEQEFEKLKAQYKKRGLSERDAAFRAMDDMFARRIEQTGGKRIPRSASIGAKGEFFMRVERDVTVGGDRIPPGFWRVTVDDDSYNCHSYTFHGGKESKRAQLNKIAKKVPEGPVKGKAFVDADALIAAGIHFEVVFGVLTILPRWIADPREFASLLGPFRKRRRGEKLTRDSIAMYEGDGSYPHSAKVIDVDSSGDALRVRGKFGHFSLFEHAPGAVPAHYGKPVFWAKR
jgi:hypothetical protein